MPQLIVTDTPAQEAGKQISSSIQEHVGDTVCILSGGSALDVVEYIQPGKKCFHNDCHKMTCDISECRTIFIMGDERVSREPDINNFLQLQRRYIHHPILNSVIQTVPKENQSAKDFAHTIEETFFSILTELNNPKIILLLGVGTDGHTAGIFPLSKTVFQETYPADQTYVPVTLEGLTIDSRASFTPDWILQNVDELIGYVVGTDKREILTKLNSEDKKLNERPAELLKLHTRSTVYTDLDVDTHTRSAA